MMRLNSFENSILSIAFSGKTLKCNNRKCKESKKLFHNRKFNNLNKEDIDFNIPKNWSVKLLSDVFEMQTGNSINKEIKKFKYEKVIEGRSYLSTKDIGFFGEINYDTGVKIPFDEDFKVAPSNSVLMCIEGGSAGEKIAITEKDICYGNKLVRFTDKDDVNYKYLYYYLLSPQFRLQFFDEIGGIIGGVGINKIRKIVIPFPSQSEQKEIVYNLDDCYDQLKKVRKKVKKLEFLDFDFEPSLHKSILRYLINGKLFETDEIKYEYKFDKFTLEYSLPQHWKVIKLGKIISLISGRDMKKGEYNDENRGIPYMTGASNFENGSLIINRWVEKPSVISKKDDLLITCKGTIGDIAINNVGDIHIARQIMAIRTVENLDYIKIFLKFYIDNLTIQARSMIPGISRKHILDAMIPLPPIEEQDIIVSTYSKLVKNLDEVSKIIEGTIYKYR